LKNKIKVYIIPTYTYRKAGKKIEYIEKLAKKIIDFITTSPVFRAIVAGGVIGAGIGAAVGFGAGAIPGLIFGVVLGPLVVGWLTGYIAWYNEQDNDDQDLNTEQYSTIPIPEPVIQNVTAHTQLNSQVQQSNQ
jgi:uncharacterized protein DUF6861